MPNHIFSIDDLLKMAVAAPASSNVPSAPAAPKNQSPVGRLGKSISRGVQSATSGAMQGAKALAPPKPPGGAASPLGAAARGASFANRAAAGQQAKSMMGSALGAAGAQPKSFGQAGATPRPAPPPVPRQAPPAQQAAAAPTAKPSGRNPSGTAASSPMPRRVATTATLKDYPKVQAQPAPQRKNRASRGTPAASTKQKPFTAPTGKVPGYKPTFDMTAPQNQVRPFSMEQPTGGAPASVSAWQQTPRTAPGPAPARPARATQAPARPAAGRNMTSAAPAPSPFAAPQQNMTPAPQRGPGQFAGLQVQRGRATAMQKADNFDQRMEALLRGKTPEEQRRIIAASPMYGKSPAERRRMILENRRTTQA